MGRRKGQKGHMARSLSQDIVLIGMRQLEMVGFWIHVTGGVMTMDFSLVLV